MDEWQIFPFPAQQIEGDDDCSHAEDHRIPQDRTTFSIRPSIGLRISGRFPTTSATGASEQLELPANSETK